MPLSDSTRWPHLSASPDSLHEVCLTLGLPKFGVVVFKVGVKQRTVGEESETATAGQQQSDGLVAVLAGGRRACVRTHHIGTALVETWLKPHLPKGRLAKDPCLHLAEQRVGFLSSGGRYVPEEAVSRSNRCSVACQAQFDRLQRSRAKQRKMPASAKHSVLASKRAAAARGRDRIRGRGRG